MSRTEVRLLVCGGRDYDNKEQLYRILNQYRNRWAWPIAIISGMAKGADALGYQYAKEWGLTRYEFPADWETHGKSAGPIRNQQMLDEGKPDFVIAFPTPKSIGTWDMIKRANKAGVEVTIIGR